jgi:hypothetical protein
VFERNAAHFAGSEYHAASVKTGKRCCQLSLLNVATVKV